MFENLTTHDCETYPNYFLAAFMRVQDGRKNFVELTEKDAVLTESQHRKLYTLLASCVNFGFNNINFDLPVMVAALNGYTCEQICNLANRIINDRVMWWQHEFDVPSEFQFFDLIEVAPGVKTSLKLYGGRMHSRHLQDLPIAPNTVMTDNQKRITKRYCVNDLQTNIDLYNKNLTALSLRHDMVKDYGWKVMSKSDAQIAEVVLKKELNVGNKKAPTIPKGKRYRYRAPDFISFKTPKLQKLLRSIHAHPFELNDNGYIQAPDFLKKETIKYGFSEYQVGIGGLHSVEKQQIIIPKEDEILQDADVTSYYPAIILNLELFPAHLGEMFLKVYRAIVNERIEFKRKGMKKEADSKKITANGTFGKLASKWSFLYSPDLMLNVTMTGQLSLLKLIEMLEMENIRVVSANTDGVVALFKKDQQAKYKEICESWEMLTGFNLEYAQYQGLYSRDVNNYFAHTVSGEVKTKGTFAKDSLMKNPQAHIITKSVVEYLTKGTPIVQTIGQSSDVREFITVRTVKGGGVWRDNYLGKVVRWYYSLDNDPIRYKINGNLVAKSEGSKPIMTVAEFPDDIDYTRYVQEATAVLNDLGYLDF